jgi:hypothetical protein
MSTDPEPANSRTSQFDSERLDSWKEIASYLKRDVRTVQRWEEHEGLPVHRHLHRKQGSVYAYKQELDAWWRNHVSTVGTDVDTQPAPAEESSDLKQFPELPSVRKRILGRIPISIRVAFLVVLAGVLTLLVWVMTRHANISPVASVYLSGNQLVALNASGTAAWKHTYTRPPVSSNLYPSTPDVTCHDQEADVLVSVAWHDGESSELDCFSNTGSLMWSFTVRDKLTFGSQTFSPPWGLQGLELLRVNGQGRVAVALHHDVWWPSMVVLLDTEGRTVGKFVNSDWILSLKAVRTSSGMLLLAGGTSNSGDGAMLAVLDPAKLEGTSPERAGSIYECNGCGQGRPVKYFIFPRSEVNAAAGTRLSFTNLDESNEMIFARTQEARGSGRYETAEGIFTFSPEIDLVRAVYSDGYWYAHKQLEDSGAIKHSRSECPDRFGPRRILSWDPQNGWKEIHLTVIQQ